MVKELAANSNRLKEEKSEKFFENSIWMTVKDAAKYLSRTENAIRILICRKVRGVF